MQYFPGVVKYTLSALFRNLCNSCISVCALLLLSCMHSLGLGLDLGISLDRIGAHTRFAELPIKSDGLYLMTPYYPMSEVLPYVTTATALRQ